MAYETMVLTYNHMKKLGGNVEMKEIPGGLLHSEAIVPAIFDAKKWFDSFNQNTNEADILKASQIKTKANPFFKDQSLYFEFVRVLSKALEHGSDIGESIYTAGQIKEGELFETLSSWHNEWKKLAERVEKIGDECLAKGHKISARDAYMRATEYYRCADFFIRKIGEQDEKEILYLCKKWHDCFNKARVLFDPSFEEVKIPYEGTTLPAYFMRAQNKNGAAPTIVINTGFDGTAEELIVEYGFDAARRGYNVLAFEGPGQGQVVRNQKLYFRYDWENVITPVVDYLLTRKDVDPNKIILYGISMGGYMAPRAAAFEHRLAACIANGGVYDVLAGTMAGSGFTREEAVNMIMNKPEEIDKLTLDSITENMQTYWGVTHGMYVFGAKTPSELFKKQISWTMKDCAVKIECPTLIIDVEKEQFFGSQAKQLYNALKCPKARMFFRTDEGADLHCQIGARLLSNQRIFDWLDNVIKK